MPGRVDLSHARRVHVIGAGGAGMSAISTVLAARGHTVHGSDLKRSAVSERLEALGIPVSIGHRAENVGDADMVVISTAIPRSNPELQFAISTGIEVYSRADMLASLVSDRRVIAVSGTHGKTTTTSMLSLCLVEAGMHPSFLVGGDINETGTNAVWDEGEWVVVEADESDGTFLSLDTEVAVITNIEPDHLDHYGDFESYVAAFVDFASMAKRGFVTSADNARVAEIARDLGGESVGFDKGASWRIVEATIGADGSSFRLSHKGSLPTEMQYVPVTGEHNLRNGALAAVAANRAGVSFAATSRALARFSGVARRFEHRGSARGITFVDDYAHLPGEVDATLRAARLLAPRRIVAVFQPHRYSRTAVLATDFGDALALADVVVVLDVYPAGEPVRPGVTGWLVADSVNFSNPGLPVHYVPRRSDLPSLLNEILLEGDLCLTMGAGDITTLADEMLLRWGEAR
ncbi:MAG: UDP-N-acetylmuramate--L-alanine ligase [Actinobacteria bacterium]|nr:UDP-N-acetylmuramate--L-alanine ligase [Actinomycetota bacterium]MCL5446376.1 UDP-N-acetylmuramate--L-alanine ligase [Actinomycetota bacterium]